MKLALLFTILLPLGSFSQTTITTTGGGNFLNPFIWDCNCIPQNGDSVIIKHSVTMNTDIYYNTGRITIKLGGSLIQDATDRAMWTDGSASIYNHGNLSCNAMLISPNAELFNSGSVFEIDSLLNQGTIMSTGGIDIYNFLNDEGGTINNEAQMVIMNDMNNQGYLKIGNSASLQVDNDFSNCNIQNLSGVVENNGTVCITNNFSNCPGDTLKGSGNYYVGGSSSNFGIFTGNFDFHTPSGTMDFSGTIEPGVTVTTGTCILTAESLPEPLYVGPYPNPTTGILFVDEDEIGYSILNTTGELALSGIVHFGFINMRNLKSGVYFLKLDNGKDEVLRIVKI